MAASSSGRPNHTKDVGILLQSWPASVLMWSSHFHEPQFWEAIISPIRNAHLQKDGSCELLTLADLKGRQRSKGQVAEFHLHAWPQEELLQL